MTATKPALQKKRDDVLQLLLAHVESNQPLLVLKAPPGSGKTYVITRAVALGFDPVTALLGLVTLLIVGAAVFTRRKMQDLRS